MKSGIATLTALVLTTAAPTFAQEADRSQRTADCLRLYHTLPSGSMELSGAQRCLEDINRRVRQQWEVQAYLGEVPVLLESMQLSYLALELTPLHALELGLLSVRMQCESYRMEFIQDIVDLEASLSKQEQDLESRFPSLAVDPAYVETRQKRVNELSRLRKQGEAYHCVPPARVPQPPQRYYRKYIPGTMQA